jgi:hypothetical protein
MFGEHHPVAPGASVEPAGGPSWHPWSASRTTRVSPTLDTVVGLSSERRVEAFLALFT